LNIKQKKKLEAKFGSGLPRFPPQKFIGTTDPAFIEKRRKQIEHYLTELLSVEKFRTCDVVKKTLLKGVDIVISPPQLALNSTVIGTTNLDSRTGLTTDLNSLMDTLNGFDNSTPLMSRSCKTTFDL
jgi:hypothetical protein